MKLFTHYFTVLCLSAVFFACDEHPVDPGGEQPPCGPIVDQQITQAVLDNHLTGFALRDVNKIMFDYTEGSVLVTPEGVFRGLDEIETYYENLLPAFPSDGTLFNVDIQTVEQNVAYIVWHAETPALNVPLGTDTFIVEDGKIMRQTFVAQIQPK